MVSALLERTELGYIPLVEPIERGVSKTCDLVFTEFAVIGDLSSNRYSNNDVRGVERLEQRQGGTDKI